MISGEFTEATILLRAADGSTVQVQVKGSATGTLTIAERLEPQASGPFVKVLHDIALTLSGEVEVDGVHDLSLPQEATG
jgi:hypothetical protein